MKKILFLAAAVLSFMACSNESVDPNALDVTASVSKGIKLSFQFSLPSDPVTYADTKLNHTNEERKIHRLDIYQFSSAAGNATLEEVYKEVPTSEVSGQQDRYNATITVNTTGNKRFVLVANNVKNEPGFIAGIENPEKGVSGITYEQFKAKETAALDPTKKLNATPLVMTHEQMLEIKATEAPTPEIATLNRIMARVDVKNEDDKFTIESLELQNVHTKAYVLEKNGTEGAVGNDVPPGIFNFPQTAVPAPGAPVSGIGYNVVTPAVGQGPKYTHYEHVFYPYPSNAVTAESQAPTMIIKGKLYKGEPGKEVNVVYKQKLKKVGESNYLGFKRNHVYTLVIKKAISDTELEAGVYVNKWHEQIIESSTAQIMKPVITGAEEKTIMVGSSPKNIFTWESLSPNKVLVEKDGGTIILHYQANTNCEIILQEGNEDYFDLYKEDTSSAVALFHSSNERTGLGDKDRIHFRMKPNSTTSRRVAVLRLRSIMLHNNYIDIIVEQKN